MTGTRAVVYCRISRDDKADEDGVTRQRQDCLKLVERNGWTIVPDGDQDTYIDNDISGAKDESGRPAFARLIAAIKAGKVDKVVATAQARIYRDTAAFLGFYDIMAAGGVSTLVLTNEADVTIGGSRFVPTIVAANDEEYRRYIGEQVRNRLLDKARKGEPTGGGRPFGYGRNPANDTPEEKAAALAVRNEINESEAGLIRDASQRILEGASLKSIVRDWRDRGAKTSRGKEFTPTAIKNILMAPRMVGLRVHKGEVIGEGQWEPILDEPTYRQVCALLSDPSRRQPRPSKVYPLRGVATCGLCGEFLQANPRSGGRRYKCRKECNGCGGVSISADQLERYVFDLVLPLADSPDVRDAMRDEDEINTQQAQELVEGNDVDKKKDQMSDDYADGVLDRQTFLRQLRRLDDRIATRDKQLATMTGQNPLDRLTGGVEATWDSMPVENKRAIIQSLVGRIEVGKVIVQGSHRFDPRRVSISWRPAAVGLYFSRDEAGKLVAQRRPRSA